MFKNKYKLFFGGGGWKKEIGFLRLLIFYIVRKKIYKIYYYGFDKNLFLFWIFLI